MSDRPSPQFDNSQKPSEELNKEVQGTLTQFPIKDKDGNSYTVDYFTFQNNFLRMDDPRVGSAFSDVMRIAQKVFPYGERAVDRVVNKFNSADALDIIKTPDNMIVGFHVYNFLELPIREKQAKVMYTEYAAVAAEFQGKGLTTQARLPIIEKENPDILCGSTGNPAVYLMNRKVTDDKGYVLYPTDAITPAPIAEVAQIVASRFRINEVARLDNRLVLTYPSTASRGKIPHPLFDEVLQLKENQHLFYLAIKPELQQKIVQ